MYSKGQSRIIDVITIILCVIAGLGILSVIGGLFHLGYQKWSISGEEITKPSPEIIIPEAPEINKKPIEKEEIFPEEKIEKKPEVLMEEAPEVICQNECSQIGFKKCSNNGYQICGDYDADSCLEWGSVAACSPNTICRNGNCVQRECYEGTPLETCSFHKPEYCTQEGELVKNCEICGCSNLMKCKNNICVKKIVSLPSYGCTFCQGFCYVNDKNTVSICTDDGKYFEWPKDELTLGGGTSCMRDSECSNMYNTAKCIKNRCVSDLFDRPWGIPIKVTPIYPRSIEQGEDFDFVVNVENLDNTPIEITIDYIYRFHYSDTDPDELKIAFNKTKKIMSNSEDSFTIPIAGFNRKSSNAEISFNIKTGNSEIIYHTFKTGPIIVYDSRSKSFCGLLRYNTENAVCMNDILYPTGLGMACYNNKDCLGDAVCINYNCLRPSMNVGNALDRQYKVGIVPIFVYEDYDWHENEKKLRVSELKKLASEASNWFDNERKFQNAKNNFDMEYEFYKNCPLSKKELVNVLKSCDYWGNECEKKTLSKCGINFDEYDIIAVHSYYQPNMNMNPLYEEWRRIGVFGTAGINFGDIIIFGLEDERGYPDIGVLIHETLHSFGENDLYSSNGYQNETYQERDCNLYRAQWKEFAKNPHLCNWEAKIIGWKD
ncbi:hypothetical protein KJ841_00870 [Patescibacteria group bacterium]|nr:hypothetical protein [Patescibacteria group bacterium]